MDEPRVGKPAERPQVDMAFGVRIMARDIAWDHAGVGRERFPRHHGQADTRLWLHAEHLQHRHMGVAAAD